MTKDEHPPHIEVEVIGYEMGTPDPYNNQFPLSVDVKYILQGEASGLLTISGSLNLLLHTAGDVYEVTLESDNPDTLFEFGRG